MNDLISREDAIEECKLEFLNPNVERETEELTLIDQSFAKGWNNANSIWIKALEKLPSANPDLSGYSDRLWETAYDRGYERCRQDSIDVAKQHWYKPDIAKALEELPSAQPEKKDFEKQLHDMFDHIWECEIDHLVYQDTVGDLMSAVIQAHYNSAQPEIIRCKNCKWWDKSEDSPFGYCMAMKHGYMSANWEIGIYRRYKGDFYCADAERRTDEIN